VRPLLRSAIIAAAVVVAAAVGEQASAQAVPNAGAEPCVVQANLPARITINDAIVKVPVPLSGCPNNFDWAHADLKGPPGVVASLVYDGTRTENLNLYALQLRPGVYATSNGDGYTTGFDPLGWHYTTTTIKFGTTASVSTVVIGAKTTVTVTARRFDSASESMIPYAATVGLRTATSPTGPWYTIGTLKTGAGSGKASGTYGYPKGRYYQMWFGDSASFYGSYSPIVRS
jgi:hypothetical protein